MSELADAAGALVNSLRRQGALWDEIQVEQERATVLRAEVERLVATEDPYVEMTIAKRAIRDARMPDCRPGCLEVNPHVHDNVGGAHLLG